MKLFLLQLITATTATGLITFVVTHLHSDLVAWTLWFLHWIIAIPIAVITIRYLQPIYRRWLKIY